MNKKRNKKKATRPQNLIMDAIYESQKPEVQAYYRQVMKEENLLLRLAIDRGESWSIDDMLNKIAMRMGVAFFELLSPRNRAFFMRDYPRAFTIYGQDSSVNPLAAAV